MTEIEQQLAGLRHAMHTIADDHPTPEERQAQRTARLMQAHRIMGARPGLLLHNVIAVLEAQEAVQFVDAAATPTPTDREAVLAEVVAWLTKKASECQDRTVAEAIVTLASKVRRGAVRPNNLLGADLSTLDPATPADRAAERPLSPYYEHPVCGFHWHGRDGMDIPLRDGQPLCPRCELRRQTDAIDRVLALADRLDATARETAGPDAVHPVAAHIRHQLDTTATEEREHDAAANARLASGLRALMTHVGIDTTGRDITVDGRVVDQAAEEQQP